MSRQWAKIAAGLVLAGTMASACATKPAPRPVAAVAPPPPAAVCADFSFPIYFDTGSDQISPAARQVLADAAQRVRGCVLGRVEVVGLADAGGSVRGNLTLSRRRAASVAQALAAARLPAPAFDVEGVGEAGAVTPEGAPEPLRRRTEVVIRAAPPPPRKTTDTPH